MKRHILLALGLIAVGGAALAQTTATETETEAEAAEAESPAASAAGPDTVIASVNGEVVTLGDIVSIRAELPPQYQSIPDRQLYEGLTEQMVNQILLRQAAERADFDKRASVERGLRLQKTSYLAELYIRDRLDGRLTSDVIENEYNARYANQPAKLEWNASHILVEDEETAKEVAAEAQAGADFAELAKAKSTGPSGPRGGALGWFGEGQMVPEFQEGVMALEVGAVSNPVKSQFGWHVIKLNETRETPPPALSEVAQELVGQLSREITDAIVQALREDSEVFIDETLPGVDKLRDDAMIGE